MVEIITIQRISQSVLVAILIFDAVLDDDIRNVVDRFRDPLKLYLTHLDRLQQQAIEWWLEILPLSDILRKDQFVHIPLNRIDSLQVILNIHHNLSDPLIDASQLIPNIPYLLLGVLAFSEDMVVALVLLQLERLDDEGEIIIDFLQLLTVELLWLDQLLFYRLLGGDYRPAHLLQLLQEGSYLSLSGIAGDGLISRSESGIGCRVLRGGGEEIDPVSPLGHLGDTVPMASESDSAFLAEIQPLSIDLSVISGLLPLVVLAMLLEEWFGGGRGLRS